MFFLGWGLFGLGSFLAYTQLIGVNPFDAARAALTGKPQPARNSFASVIVESVEAKIAKEPVGALGGPGAEPTGALGGAGSPSDSRRATVVNFAKAQLGERYVFGAAGPNTWDCSGLTLQAYKQVGITLPHSAHLQQLRGTKVTAQNALPGDLVFWGAVSSHVAIYVGDGKVIHAPAPGQSVKIEAMWNRTIVNVKRLL